MPAPTYAIPRNTAFELSYEIDALRMNTRVHTRSEEMIFRLARAPI